MILRARVVLPISRPPIPNGAIEVHGNRIASVGRWRDLCSQGRSRTVDLGEVLLLPGLVNAHCHLDYTHMAGQLPPPRVFTEWLKTITATKAGWGLADYAESWCAGADMLLRTGTTTVGDIEAVPQLLPKVWEATPLRVISFLEMIGITRRRLPSQILKEALDKISTASHPRSRAALSPHAPYSTLPELLQLSGRAARRHHLPVSTHVAESQLEFDMFAHRRGPMYEWLQGSGRDMSDCGQGSPVRQLACCSLLGPELLVAHANYLARGDVALLARQQVSIAHCPRSQFYFQHQSLPLQQLMRAGVNVCLGTDSLASVYKTRNQRVELNLFEEMRLLAWREPWLPARTIVRMATINGARALGLAGRAGELRAGAFADVIVIPGPQNRADEAVVQHQGPVSASMIDGQWAIPVRQ